LSILSFSGRLIRDFEAGASLNLYKTDHSESMVENFAFRPVAAGKAQSGESNDRRARGA
jgi:hypothetical protein